MPVMKLIAGNEPAAFDVQDTAFSHDVLGRYVCNTWDEVESSISAGGYPFDAIVIGAGMFGAYAAEKLYRVGASAALRVLVLDGGALLFATHIQNLPQRVGGKIGGPDFLRARDDGQAQNVIWGMPWISNEGFPGLAYCLGGRSLFWGGWAPRLTDADLQRWPAEVRDFLAGTAGSTSAYAATEREIGTQPTADFMLDNPLHNPLKQAFVNAIGGAVKAIEEAPLAVLGAPPATGIFAFDKFSSSPFLIDAVRDDVAANGSHGDVSRRLFVAPRVHVVRLVTAQGAIERIELSVNGQPKTLRVPPSCAVILANGTIEATRLALDGLGVGDNQFGSPRLGNLMGHLRSNIVVRIKRSVFLNVPPTDLETVALLVRGEVLGRRFHLQVSASASAGSDSERNMWNTVPDIDLLDAMKANQDPDWISITLRGIGEMEDRPSLSPNPGDSWIDLSPETDQWGARRAYVNLVASANDRALWQEMDKAAFELAEKVAGAPGNIEFFHKGAGFKPQRPQPNADGSRPWQDLLGTTHHEAGTLFMGAAGHSITDFNGKLHNVANAYVAGPALFPSIGSANPSLTALSLARKTAAAVVKAAAPLPVAGFSPLSLDPKDWKMVGQAGTTPGMRHYGNVLETFGAYGLYWYTKEQFVDFILHAEWRVGRRDDNSGVYLRIPAPNVPDALAKADAEGHEVQIDERGFDSNTNTEGHPQKRTGAIYDLQAATSFPSLPVGSWNRYRIKAQGSVIEVVLNDILVNTYHSSRRTSGHIALQAHHFTSRVQFRNLAVQKL
jgi:hypothetical protein